LNTASLRRRLPWVNFLADHEYYRQLFRFALPIALQNLVISGLNMVSVLLIGQLGETSVAAVGLANQIFFLLQLVLFGISSGSAIFTAQLWGRHDIPNIRRVLGLCLLLALSGAAIFLAIAQLAPAAALGVYSTDPAVVALGSSYLRTFGWSFFFVAVTVAFASVLRSTGDVNTPLFVSVGALSLNALLSFCLIFGKWGLPALGTQGAAISVLISRILETGTFLLIVYRRNAPAALRLSDVRGLDMAFARKVLTPALPVVLNETLWSLGITAYNVAYARIGTTSIAAMNIASSIDTLAFVAFSGIGNACAIMVGNKIGANEEHKAYAYAGRSIVLVMIGGLLLGSQVWLWSPLILSYYKVSPIVIEYTNKVITIMSSLYWLRAANMVLFVGVFRSGGDTRFGLLMDGFVIWLLGVPLTFFAAFVLRLPVYWVYLFTMSEEFVKWTIALWRYFSKRWIHNLAQTVGT
jgi:putative MATE family efflux protein